MTELRVAFRNFMKAPKTVDVHVKPNMHRDLHFHALYFVRISLWLLFSRIASKVSSCGM
jgi:hypothetical protein